MRLHERFNAQAGFAVVLIVFATVYASQIPKLGLPFAGAGEPGASFMPILLVTILYVAAIRTLIQELRGIASEPGMRPEASETIPRMGIVGPVVLIVLTALFVLGLPTVGYFIAAGGYTFGVALFFNYEETGRPWRAVARALVTAVAITGFGWLFFEWLFDLTLPTWVL